MPIGLGRAHQSAGVRALNPMQWVLVAVQVTLAVTLPIGAGLLENRLRTTLLSRFAATAVTLACIGLYGTVSFLTRLRQREVGVRLALGAPRSQIVGRFLGQGLRIAVLGCIAGLLSDSP